MLATVMQLIAVNAVAAFIGSQWYTSWSIKVRNKPLFMLTGDKKYLERAQNADETAARVVRWLRPLLFVVLNAAVIVATIAHSGG